MMTAAQLPLSTGLAQTAGQQSSAGTTPSSLCSTPMTLLSAAASAANPGLPFMHHTFQYAQPTFPVAGTNAFEGMPIFVLPPNGLSQGVSLAALHRAAEVKAGLINSATEPKVDTSKHFHVFIGDLSSEVDNKMLKEAFDAYGEVSEAKVIRDALTQKSRGYGFVSYAVKEHAEKAINAMNGHWLGRRAIRTNWATRKPAEENRHTLTFEQVFNSTKADNTSVYVGNVSQTTSDADLREAFASFGAISEVRVFKAQGYAFVRFERKEDATRAIMEMNGKAVAGNTIRCSWGRTQQQQQTAITPLMTDLSPLLAAQHMLQQPVAATPYAQFAAAAAAAAAVSSVQVPTVSAAPPFWTQMPAAITQYINPAMIAPGTLLPQW